MSKKQGIRQGDLVVVRFDNSLRVGIITGRHRPGWFSFIYMEKHLPLFGRSSGRLYTSIVCTSLPRTRFLRVRSIGGIDNLHTLTASTVRAVSDTDHPKLVKWRRRFPCHYEGVHGAVIAVVNGCLRQDVAAIERGKFRGCLSSCEAR